ncbi:DUF4326 domain-containing protein [Thiomicrorhabdus sp. Milos-T2]|uniref:DUF4326 domain-containing protein n=1 Tax=Thiomicrorhabdus sp. Milos-T2 TaxID=90814 RepID=UPI0004942889|nr:DUF4326 domain-containing protein [Thiomicrorhabdus sp. Milos-T2]
MNNVLVLYPKIFNCYSKFQRKIERIVSQLKNVTLVYLDDPNGFVKKLSEQSQFINSATQLETWNIDNITHSIIFDDGEEFPKETRLLKENNVPLRQIKIELTRVINIKDKPEYKNQKSTPNYEYIGRGSYWGNPYSMYEEGDDRNEVIRKYKYDFDFEKFPNKEKSEVYKLAGKRLGCFCKPQACHGDVLADFLNSWDDGK